MNRIEHQLTHQYQPTNTSCSPTSLSMLLSFYDKVISVGEISAHVPQVKNEKGEDFGTINSQMAAWCTTLGFSVELYTADVQVIDQSWKNLSKEEIIQRLQIRKAGLKVPSLGDLWTEAYCQSYIDFLEAGGNLHIAPFIGSELLYELLSKGPILPCLASNTLYGGGRTSIDKNDKVVSDDVDGKAWNHSVVIYGYDEMGNFLVADPLKKPGRHIVAPEQMVAAIATAQLECDNMIFQLSEQA